MSSPQGGAAPTANVHFASQDDHISPSHSLEGTDTATDRRDDLNPQAQQELNQLRSQLQNNIQSSRMQHHAFEPVSLPGSQPASRVPSGHATPNKRHMSVYSGESSHATSPAPSTMHSPPLTPAASKSRDNKSQRSGSMSGRRPAPDIMTPQRSASPLRDGKDKTAVPSQPKQQPQSTIGPSGDSQPPSSGQSPAATPSGTAPGSPRPKTLSTTNTSDVSAKGKRPSTSASVTTTQSDDSQFRFGNRDPAVGYSTSGQINTSVPGILGNAPTLPASSASGTSLDQMDKRSSLFGGAKKEHDDSLHEKDSHHSSKSNLKRFFKIGGHHHHREKSEKSEHANGSEHPKRQESVAGGSTHVPFADDHGLESKYGKFGKLLGAGAGGSVRLMKRQGDGTVFAVKQFRDRHSYESEKEYNKKVTAEFCIGSTLHHGNIIETIDIVHEKGRWYEVMEYAPYDLFATVMGGKMGREEVACATLQILSGVMYLHSMGLAHRDLKLDNVVINDRGIMKLIDFGSAVVFRYPFENDVVFATGVVGSDPYLAPEVYDQPKYDPRAADVWSIAIIFCCMTLRRFPWKAPRTSDNSFRLFVSPPDPEQDKFLQERRRSSAKGQQESTEADGEQAQPITKQTTQADYQPTIKGPLRLLRLLPRETRHIIGRMLDLDPSRRATIEEMLEDGWVRNALVCRQEENGVVINAPNHEHHLVPSNNGGK